ncbi:hypothetical protein M405DRAFT_750626, partial [Rhizopogon salebrosus TDB-379]
TDLEGHVLNLTYWCNRSGALAASQFPLITTLGTKNRTVQYLITGISNDKPNYAYRMMSRVVLISLWVHAGGEIVRNVPYVRHALSMQLIAKMTQIPTISRRAVAQMRHYCHCRIVHFMCCFPAPYPSACP